MQIRPCGTTRYPQQFPNLRVREAFNIMQHYHRAGSFRKLRQRLLQPPPQLRALGWVAKGRRHCIRQLLCAPYLLSTRQIERRICDDPIQPCPERLLRIEPVQSLIRPQETFLHRVFRVLVRQDDRARHYVRFPFVQPHEAREPPLVAVPGATNELTLLIRNTWGCGQLLRGR